MVEAESVLCGAKCMKANALIVGYDKPSVFRIKRIAQTLACTLRIVASNALQTLSHCSNTKRYEFIEIRLYRRNQYDRGCRYLGHKLVGKLCVVVM